MSEKKEAESIIPADNANIQSIKFLLTPFNRKMIEEPKHVIKNENNPAISAKKVYEILEKIFN